MSKRLTRLPLVGRLFGAPPPTVPLLRFSGVIAPGARLRRGLSLEAVSKPIAEAFSVHGAKAVAVVVNSPGGSPVQSRLIHDRLRALSSEKKLPVFAFAEDVAASGGYMLALAGDEIYADESSIVGSIGVISAGFGFPELLKKIGVERRIYAVGDNKSILDPFEPERADDVTRLKSIQARIHDSFVDLVKQRRGARIAAADEDLFDGAFWTGARALELGLVDGLSEPRRFFRDRFGEDVKIKEIGRGGRSPLARLAGAAAGRPCDAGRWSSAVVEDAAARFEAAALWSRYGL